MWVCLNNSFLSIVADKDDDSRLLVRARVKGHIENIFPYATVLDNEGSDYAFRTFLPRLEVVNALADKMEMIDYTNFKKSVKEPNLHDAYSYFWGIMRKLQDRFTLTF